MTHRSDDPTGDGRPSGGHGARAVARMVPATRVREGAGFVVHRAFPTAVLRDVDPFLLLDQMGPTDYGPGEALGAPDHPHRGFETVTYMLEGAFEHRDSAGHAGRIGPGDLQWMTAGAGVVHSEMPAAEIRRTGGRVHGVQLWVNLPRAEKMIPPRYQEYPASAIPRRSGDGVTLRVLAGSLGGLTGPVHTHTPVTVAHLSIAAGATFAATLPAGQRAMSYGLSGPGAGMLLLYAQDGDTVVVEGEPGRADREVLLLAGAPLGEPIARFGPFVMSTEAELIRAVEDFRAGRFGEIRTA